MEWLLDTTDFMTSEVFFFFFFKPIIISLALFQSRPVHLASGMLNVFFGSITCIYYEAN